jgi:hypothetical protein
VDATLDVAANQDDCMPLDMILPDDNAQAEADNTVNAIPSDVPSNPDGDATPEDNAKAVDRDEVEAQDDDSDELEAEDDDSDEPKAEDDDWGEKDEVEYVGVDDEKENYKDVLNAKGEGDCAYYPDSDEKDTDPLTVDDERGCEGVVHVTDVDNPEIAVGVTFEDGFCFKRCIRQYVVLNEVELVVPYSESRWYRAYCKAKRCRWRIHVSQCPDGKTWQVFESFFMVSV